MGLNTCTLSWLHVFDFLDSIYVKLCSTVIVVMIMMYVGIQFLPFYIVSICFSSTLKKIYVNFEYMLPVPIRYCMLCLTLSLLTV